MFSSSGIFEKDVLQG